MHSFEPCPFPPPWPSNDHMDMLEAESSSTDPEGPLGPLAQQWVSDLCSWYQQLQKHFEFDPTDLAANVRRSAPRWRRRLRYLKTSDPRLFDYIMGNIEQGHRIPFGENSLPQKFFRHRNPQSLSKDKVRAWEAIFKDIAHGAIRPVDLSNEDMPGAFAQLEPPTRVMAKLALCTTLGA